MSRVRGCGGCRVHTNLVLAALGLHAQVLVVNPEQQLLGPSAENLKTSLHKFSNNTLI